MKRFVRDHFRYHDHVWCAAHRVVSLVRADTAKHYASLGNERAVALGGKNANGVSNDGALTGDLSPLFT
jgi:hypothetical protein